MKLRILYDNKADDSTVTADTTAGSLVASNLLTDIKTEVHRSTAKSVLFTFTWSSAVLGNCIILPHCSLTSTATARVKCYVNTGDTSPAVDSGTVLCCGYTPLGIWGWGTTPLGVNAFTYGGGVYARVYFTTNAFKKLTIQIDDTDNTNAYLEHSRALIGQYWSPQTNPDYGGRVVMNDNSLQERNDAGDLRAERGPIYRTVAVDMNLISEADRPMVYELLRVNGSSRPLFISLYPEDGDPSREQSHQVYGRMPDRQRALQMLSMNYYAAPLVVEEI